MARCPAASMEGIGRAASTADGSKHRAARNSPSLVVAASRSLTGHRGDEGEGLAQVYPNSGLCLMWNVLARASSVGEPRKRDADSGSSSMPGLSVSVSVAPRCNQSVVGARGRSRAVMAAPVSPNEAASIGTSSRSIIADPMLSLTA